MKNYRTDDLKKHFEDPKLYFLKVPFKKFLEPLFSRNPME